MDRAACELDSDSQEKNRMKNPWLKKNPLMSMWLSGANAVLGRARNVMSGEGHKQQTRLTSQITRSWIGAWGRTGKKRRRR
jgi:hypothetical protein